MATYRDRCRQKTPTVGNKRFDDELCVHIGCFIPEESQKASAPDLRPGNCRNMRQRSPQAQATEILKIGLQLHEKRKILEIHDIAKNLVLALISTRLSRLKTLIGPIRK
jgi:hypothetical protein